jgi:hypothetical protein
VNEGYRELCTWWRSQADDDIADWTPRSATSLLNCFLLVQRCVLRQMDFSAAFFGECYFWLALEKVWIPGAVGLRLSFYLVWHIIYGGLISTAA